MNKNKIIICGLLALSSISTVFAQNTIQAEPKEKKSSKAWEIGLGGSVFQFNRTSFTNFSKLDNSGYQFDLSLKHTVYGMNIYLARELNSHFYVDIQGTSGFTKESLHNEDKTKWLFMAGAGIQWRLGDYFGSKFIDPYLRAGINYMHKDFDISYYGTEGLTPDQMQWALENMHNKDGVDRKDLMPISLGGGLNMWMNDRLGIGFQADYLLMPYKGVANSLQGTVRVMYRFGGESKKEVPAIEYVEIERIVEKPIVVEKIVEKIVEKPVETQTIYDYLKNLNFDFDKATLSADSEVMLDDLASLLKQHPDKKYVITGYTDAKGSSKYNENLSKKRAAAVREALISRGVNKSNLKSTGVGSRVSLAESNTSDNVRRGDRKVTIEEVNNNDYWNYLSDSNL